MCPSGADEGAIDIAASIAATGRHETIVASARPAVSRAFLPRRPGEACEPLGLAPTTKEWMDAAETADTADEIRRIESAESARSVASSHAFVVVAHPERLSDKPARNFDARMGTDSA
jgi:hypothetical protein